MLIPLRLLHGIRAPLMSTRPLVCLTKHLVWWLEFVIFTSQFRQMINFLETLLALYPSVCFMKVDYIFMSCSFFLFQMPVDEAACKCQFIASFGPSVSDQRFTKYQAKGLANFECIDFTILSRKPPTQHSSFLVNPDKFMPCGLNYL